MLAAGEKRSHVPPLPQTIPAFHTTWIRSVPSECPTIPRVAPIRPIPSLPQSFPPPPPPSRDKAYPWIDRQFPGLEVVHEDPPVFVVRDFLSPEQCRAVVEAAESRSLPPVAYDNSVHLDLSRLRALPLLVAVGSCIPARHALEGAGDLAAAAQAFGASFALGCAGAAALAVAATRAVELSIGGAVFTGSKWSATALLAQDGAPGGRARAAAAAGGGEAAGGVAGRHPVAAGGVRDFVDKAAGLLALPASHLEPPLVTRYGPGEQQRVHLDARPAGDLERGAFADTGGQRLAQVVVYLRSPRGGGHTRFHHDALGGLSVPPTAGDALVFFPAFADGACDLRMAHSGDPVEEGEKWILNTWACERETGRRRGGGAA